MTQNAVVMLDPGHGGEDSGYHFPKYPPFELVEKSLALTVALHARAALACLGWGVNVTMTREFDESMGLYSRGMAAKAIGADLVLSLHCNASPDPKVQGMMTFCWPGNAVGREVALAIGRSAPAGLYRPRVICHETHPPMSKDLEWLKASRAVVGSFHCTAVLVELGHASNIQDRLEMADPHVHRGLVSSLLCGVSRFLQLREAI